MANDENRTSKWMWVVGGVIFFVIAILVTSSFMGDDLVQIPLISSAPSYQQKVAEVPLRTTQGLGPLFTVVDKDQTFAYVTVPKRDCFENPKTAALEDRVSLIGVVDLTKDEIATTIELDFNVLGAALSPDGRWLYVTNSFDDRLTVINTQTQEAVTTLAVGPNPIPVGDNICDGGYNYKPQFVVFSSDGRYAYTSNSKSGTVSVIDTSNHTLHSQIPVVTEEEAKEKKGFAGSVWGIAAHPTRNLIYAAGKISGQIYILNSETNTKVGELKLDPPVAPLGLAVDPQGENLWIADISEGVVVIVNTQTEQEITRVSIGAYSDAPSWITFSRSGKWAFVAPVSGNTITTVDAKSFEAVGTTQATEYPFMGIPVGNELLLTPRTGDSLDIYR